MDELTALTRQLHAKEDEWVLWVNTHEIPQELRNLFVDWAALKTQISVVSSQLHQAYELEREAFNKERQKRLAAAEAFNEQDWNTPKSYIP